MNIVLVLPILIPLASAVAALLAWHRPLVQRSISIAGMAGLFVAALALLATVRQGGIQVTQMGGWPAPFGISLVADLFSSIMVVLAGLIGLAVTVYSLGSIDAPRESHGYWVLLHVLLMGVCGAFLTGDLFNLYVWFEVMLMASFVLMALGGERAQLEGAIKYVTLNLMASAVFLAGVGIVYGVAGTLNIADLARKLSNDPGMAGLATLLAMLFLVSFGIKAAAFPLFFWLPASYHTPPPAVSAVFAGLLTKVGVYALIRVFTVLFAGDIGYTHTLLLFVAGLTMVTGVLGAAAQSEFRRILSFHIVSQIGYMIMGLGLAGVAKSPAVACLAMAGSVFYIVHHIIVKTNLFLVAGVARRWCGSYELKSLGGLYAKAPGLSILFLIPALSLAGLPPLSGFFAKLTLVRAGLESEQYAIVITALVVSWLTLYSMTKIWAEAFWKPGSESEPTDSLRTPGAPASSAREGLLLVPIGVLAALTISIGFAAESLFRFAHEAAVQLLARDSYMNAVLGG